MNELRINAHNETVLYLWKANMGLQYILDPYACVSMLCPTSVKHSVAV